MLSSRSLRFVAYAFIASIVPAAAHAQTAAVSGRIVGEGERALAGASVVVRVATDTSVIAGGQSADANGAFRIVDLRAGSYLIEASFVGFTKATRTITLAAGDTLNLGVLQLAVSAVALDAVSVETERALATFAPDRTIYSTDAMPVARGGVATDVLRSIPELEVDIEGAVKLRNANPQIWLNGRPAPMQGDALNAFLQQMPADRIARVEIIANPSARFDAEGSAGIVNIVLKDNVGIGISGNAFANASSRGELGGGGRVAFQKGILTLFGGTFLRYSDRASTNYDLRQNLLATPITFLEQVSAGANTGLSGSGDMTAEIKLTEKATAWIEGRYSDFGSESDGLMTTTHMDEARNPMTRYERTSTGDYTRLFTNATAGLKHKFAERGHEIQIEGEIQRGNNGRGFRYITTYELEALSLAALQPPDHTFEDEDESEDELSLEADYVRPLGEDGQIEVGLRSNIRDTDNERLLRTMTGDEFASNAPSAYGFREEFNSAYVTLTQNFGKFGTQLGLRGELAETELDVTDTGDLYENSYRNLFPSASLSYEPAEGKQLRLSYSRRISRPSIWNMNPVDRSVDPLNHYVGNPDLEPTYMHSLSFDASNTTKWGTLRLAPYYRRATNAWTQIKLVDELGISTLTWKNLATNETFGTTLTASVRPIGGWSGFASMSVDREVRDASNLNSDYSGTSYRVSLRTNVQGRITSTLNAQMNASYNPPRKMPQGEQSAMYFTTLGLRQTFLDRKASINLNVMDPFDIYRFNFTTNDRSHVQVGRSNFSMRAATISFSYTFGKQPESERTQRPQEEVAAPAETIR